MEEQLVGVGVAVLAKSIGFNIPVLNYYYGVNIPEKFGQQIINHNDSIFNTCYSAPTQSLLQRWLREVHNIQIDVNFDSDDFTQDKNARMQYKAWVFYPKTGYETIEAKLFDTYEQALEEGLKEALMLIKI